MEILFIQMMYTSQDSKNSYDHGFVVQGHIFQINAVLKNFLFIKEPEK